MKLTYDEIGDLGAGAAQINGRVFASRDLAIAFIDGWNAGVGYTESIAEPESVNADT